MPNPVFPSSAIQGGKITPNLNYIYDGTLGEWRPMIPADFAGEASFSFAPPTISGYRNIALSGEAVSVSNSATKLAGFLIDNNTTSEPLFIQFYSNPYTGSPTPILTYPMYGYSTIEQNFPYSMEGFQGIIVKISEDAAGTIPWDGAGVGVLANIYYRA